MIDYLSHVAVLKQQHASLASESISDSDLAGARDKLLADVSTEENAAYLGSCIDHLIAHAVSDGLELNFLETGANLWKRGLLVYEKITLIREAIETVLADPTVSGAVDKFNSAVQALPGIKTDVTQILSEAEVLKNNVLPLPHLRPHPRQEDKKISDWNLSNLFLARRTDAFVRSVFKNAKDSQTHSFAFGMLASYGGNLAGSSYLGRVVGGPRRSHRYRDRLARNSVGAWLAHNSPLPSLGELSKRFSFGYLTGTIQLPTGISNSIVAGIKEVYKTSELPDLTIGLNRMVRHLQLLDSFNRPPLPSPPIPALDPIMATLTAVEGGQVTPKTVGDGAGDPPQSGSGSTDQGDGKAKTGTLCVLAIFIAIVLIAQLIDCIIQWFGGDECEARVWKALFESEEAPASTSQQFLTSSTTPPNSHIAASIVNEFYNAQLEIWQAFDQALSFLTVSGLIYPDKYFLKSKLYNQFTSIPLVGSWPHKAEPDPENNYIFYPSSPIENPPSQLSPYATSAAPISFVNGAGGQSAWDFSRSLWNQIAKRQFDSSNLDLDADRGHGFPSWQVTAGTSINDDPVNVSILSYNEI